jgi:L-alanine-DL-glutamate epimerase-like enolase superfamily enzyme
VGCMARIDAIRTERLLVPIREEWMVRGGRGVHDRSPFLLVRLQAAGVEGLGEVSGTYRWSGEGFETAEAAVREVLAPALIGEEVSPRQARLTMNKALAGFFFTKAGIEMACWDALGKMCGVAVCTLLGGALRTSVLSKFSISGVAPSRAAAIAREAWTAGFRKFKVKVGAGLREDLERVAAVRDALGRDVSLGVDANGSWTLAEARHALSALEELEVSVIEQPLRHSDLHESARLRVHSRIPILLDESVWQASDVAQVVRIAAADAVNIYVGKAGGILSALEAMQVAKAAGIGVTMGSNQELGVGHAAIMQVLAVGDGFDLETYAPDAAGPMYYVEDIVEPEFRIKQSEVSVPTGPGLGVRLKEAAVRKYRVS